MMRPSFLLAFLLSACGFTPLYAPHHAEALAPFLETIAIAPVPDRSGVTLRNILIDRLHRRGSVAPPAYTLALTPVSESMADLDITIDDESTRRQIRVQTTYTLTSVGASESALTRTVYAIASFNVLESRFTTRVAENNARENALADLARQIERDLLLYLTTRQTP